MGNSSNTPSKHSDSIDIALIRKGLADKFWLVRQAAMKACKGREVPLEIIKLGLDDEDGDVRLAAMEALVRAGQEQKDTANII